MKWIVLIIVIIISIKFWRKAQMIFSNIVGNTNDKTSESLFILFKLHPKLHPCE